MRLTDVSELRRANPQTHSLSVAVAKANPDHDLLVRLDTKLDVLAVSFNEVRLSVGAKAETVRLEKLEHVVTDIQKKVYWAAGILTAAQFAAHYFLK